MHFLSFSEIASLLQSQPFQQVSDPAIEVLLTDSRRVSFAEHALFFAISTDRVDANQFFPVLYEAGLRCFISARTPTANELASFPEANIIIVKNVVAALQLIAAHHRHKFNYPVIGITGSNGKTIVKEWLGQLLEDKYHVVKNPRSYNSQIGVPLSVWEMNATHTLGIFEAGISTTDEMLKLQPIIDPEIGVITFIGDAHADGFESLTQKIDEKLTLFRKSSILLYSQDNELLQQRVEHFRSVVNPSLKVFTWSASGRGDMQIHRVEPKGEGSFVHANFHGEDFSFFIPFVDKASVSNAITCCAVLLCLGVSRSSISVSMNELQSLEMRLELKQGINECSIINDSYSADINSLQIALDFLSQQQQHQKKSLVLSDLLQSGFSDEKLYQRIGDLIRKKKLTRFIGIGPRISAFKAAFEGINAEFFESTDSFISQLGGMGFHDETVLLKGARIFQFERISRYLERKTHETVLEINLNALRNNLAIYQNQLKKGVKVMAMVKAFSYGSGSFEVANLLQSHGVDYLGVAYADEAVELRKAGVRLPIMVMNTGPGSYDNLLQYNLEPEIFSFGTLESFSSYLRQRNVPSHPVHIKLDTGMHRLGFLPGEIDVLINSLRKADNLNIRSVFSHLVASDDKEHDSFTNAQASQFGTLADRIEQSVGYPFVRHIANTAAIKRHPELQLDMVRLGIGLYGIDAVQRLHTVTTLRSTVAQLKHLRAGQTVGYSRKGVLERDSVIATVRIGYADGYPRWLSNGRGKMLVNGHYAPVIGNVCMDMTMIDVTGIPAAESDEVIVFGDDLPVTQLAKWAETIPYEILTNISQRVKRVYYEE